MHYALELPEIISHIFCFVCDDYDLSVLLRTCKAFEEPARAILWYTISHLNTLMYIIQLQDPNMDNEHVELLGPRFDLHAFYIRDISLNIRKDIDTGSSNQLRMVPRTVLYALGAYAKERTLFPLLHTIRYDTTGIDDIQRPVFLHRLMCNLMHPTITSIHIILNSDFETNDRLLLAKQLLLVSKYATQIQGLHVQYRHLTEGVSEHHSETLETMPILANLSTILPIARDTMTHLSVLAHLRSLDVVLHTDDWQTRPQSPMVFPVLKCLSLTSANDDVDDITSFLENVDAKALRSLSLKTLSHNINHTMDEIRRRDLAFTKLTRALLSPVREHLHSIEYTWHPRNRLPIINYFPGSTAESSYLFWLLVAPLLDMSRLRTLVLPFNSFWITDTQDVANFLPLLKKPALSHMYIPVSLQVMHKIIREQGTHSDTHTDRITLQLPDPCLGSLDALPGLKSLRATLRGAVKRADYEAFAIQLRKQFPSLEEIITEDLFKSPWRRVASTIGVRIRACGPTL